MFLHQYQVETPAPVSIVSEDRIFKWVTKVNWGYLGGSLDNPAGTLIRSGDLEMNTQTGHMKTQCEDTHVQAKVWVLRSINQVNILILDLQPPKLWENRFLY